MIDDIFTIDNLGQIVVQDEPEGPGQSTTYPEFPEDPDFGYLDFEVYSGFDLVVTATEDRPPLEAQTTDPIDVEIRLTDVNEQPNFTSGIGASAIFLPEDVDNGVFVYDFGYAPGFNPVTGLRPDPAAVGVVDDDNTPPADPATAQVTQKF